MDESTILRLPERLATIVHRLASPGGAPPKMNYSKDPTSTHDRHYVFEFGNEKYFATLMDVPTIVEVQKTVDSATYYKTSDVSQMLVVHDLLANAAKRPVVTNYELESGISPPTKGIVKNRFVRTSSEYRRREDSIRTEDLIEADGLLLETDNKAQELAHQTQTLIHEQTDASRPFMDYWGDRTALLRGSDKFKSSAQQAVDAARKTMERRAKGLGDAVDLSGAPAERVPEISNEMVVRNDDSSNEDDVPDQEMADDDYEEGDDLLDEVEREMMNDL